MNEHADTDALERILERRRSCRGYLPDPVPPPVIERLLTLAQRTPSWNNVQPWRVVIAGGEACERFRQALLDHVASGPQTGGDFDFPREYRDVYLDRRRACGWGLYESVGIVRGDRAASGRQAMENFRLFGAPHVAIVTSDEALGTYGAIDCGAYVNNFMLAAASLGLDTIAQAALAAHSAFIRNWFGIGNDRAIVCGIAFGYVDPANPANAFRTDRASLDEVVEFVD